MTQLCVTFTTFSSNVVPPEEPLSKPQTDISTSTSAKEIEENPHAEPSKAAEIATVPHWLVVAKNRRVNRDWELLLSRAPENATRCYEDLSTAPMTRKPGRVFPLKGKRYKGAWEYEVTKGDRGFYVPDAQQQKVVVYYAGEHPKNAPLPE
ncbi:hypothetical protein DP113_28140 [Brasilonema octagenarum UFV-E1]|uniref:Uncharacterized protein n=2 Tax=Brasilonema TaxID=383614 RepID=A0A856MME3_9CYAN|nr:MULTISPECIES: hypothetical protein [Brasilonema]NMF65120.1 hypothetical protein [Brasilonema octagenarum UFV-OR1]QDL11260.1 hypothetical protein DP114_28210 [Brasilonema sennae CENA114]QDL17605.1 hypothetical protein DP113_28140 [Brasilonema octagenarum UFV-E1]